MSMCSVKFKEIGSKGLTRLSRLTIWIEFSLIAYSLV